jgi:hypothetical protein
LRRSVCCWLIILVHITNKNLVLSKNILRNFSFVISTWFLWIIFHNFYHRFASDSILNIL